MKDKEVRVSELTPLWQLIKDFFATTNFEVSTEEEIKSSDLSQADIDLLTKKSTYIEELEKATVTTPNIKRSKRKSSNNKIKTNKLSIEKTINDNILDKNEEKERE